MISPKNGAKVIIFSPDKILLFHRDNIPTIRAPDCWQLVGGGIEAGETPEEALVREVSEEVSCELKKYFLWKEGIGDLGETVWTYVAFVEKDEEGKFKLGVDEGQEIGWFTIEEALKLKLSHGTGKMLNENKKEIERMMNERK